MAIIFKCGYSIGGRVSKNGCLYLSSKQHTLKILGRDWKTITKNLEENKSILSRKFKFKPYPINIKEHFNF